MDFTKVRKLMDVAVSDHAVPCSDIAITYKGELVLRYLNGTRDDAQQIPLQGNELYFLYSATKPITCVAALQLVEQGKMNLDDKLSDFIPEYKNMMIKTQQGLQMAQNPITIKHLFTMTSGMNYNLTSASILAQLEKNPNSTTQELVRAMAQEPLEFEPGTHYLYGLSHDVLAAVVEIVSGQSFGEYLQKNVFDVCGMTNTGFILDDGIKERMCSQYQYDAENDTKHLIGKENEYVLSPKYQSGGAGLISSVEDYSKFVTELANGSKLLRRETIDLMRADHLSKEAYEDYQALKPEYSYGLGVRTDVFCRFGVKGEFGWDGAASSYTFVDPDHQIAVFYATHIRDHGQYMHYNFHWLLRDAVHNCFFGEKS